MARSPHQSYFPDPELADPHGIGLIGFRGAPSVERLLAAYSTGIFPWPGPNGVVAWWSPEPRAVIELDEFHISRRLARTYRSGKFDISIDRAFSAVIRGCASAPYRGEGTWITPQMIDAYERFHEAGYAHSVEAWRDGELAGGLYGVAIGGMFAAESMFYRVSAAAKVALVYLVERLRERGFTLFDVQQYNPNTARFGAREIPRRQFLKRVRSAVRLPVRFAD